MPRDRSKPWIDVMVHAPTAHIRKTTFLDNGNVAAKYGLSTTGEWVLVPEAAVYPDECILPVTVYDEVEDSSERYDMPEYTHIVGPGLGVEVILEEGVSLDVMTDD